MDSNKEKQKNKSESEWIAACGILVIIYVLPKENQFENCTRVCVWYINE